MMPTSMGEAPGTLGELVRPHVDSFDYFLSEGLQTIVDAVEPVEVAHPLATTPGLRELLLLHPKLLVPGSVTLAASYLHTFPAD